MAWHVSAMSKLSFRNRNRRSGFREVFGVVAVNDAGRRFGYVGPVETATRGDALALVARIKRWQAGHPEWAPWRSQYWTEVDPVYGSAEYVRRDTEAAWAAREAADDPFYGEDAVQLSCAY